jgi:hypothetical protein
MKKKTYQKQVFTDTIMNKNLNLSIKTIKYLRNDF